MTDQSSRRDFLRGRSAAKALGDVLGGAVRATWLPEGSPDDGLSRESLAEGTLGGGVVRAADESYLIQISRRAMACEFEIRFSAGRYGHGTELALKALDLVETLEEQMSVFRPDSEICRINRTADAEPVVVEPRLFELLQLAMRLYAETDGALDLTTGPLWEVWGFARRAGAVPDAASLADALGRVGGRYVELDAEQKSVRFGRPGVWLSLGCIGKGYALDRCAEVLLGGGINEFLIHGGQSSVLARGGQTAAREPANPLETSWEVGIAHPLRPNRRFAEIRLSDRALATSGCWAQSFVHQGHRYGHILDPRTGHPAEGVLSTTVVAPTAALADALSTAFYVMGPDRMLDFCRDRPEIGAVMACPVRHSGGIEIQSIGLTEDELRFL